MLEVCNAGALLALDLLDFEASEIWTHLNSRFFECSCFTKMFAHRCSSSALAVRDACYLICT